MSRWDKPGVPHKGWICVETVDLAEKGGEDFYENCTMCGQEKIRYVHLMSHPTYSEQERVGFVCAGKMTGDYEGARAREKVLKSKAQRKSKWLTRKWRTSAAGNKYLNVDGTNLGVFKKGHKWGARIGDKFGSKYFSSENEAKLYLFEAYWKLINSKKD